MNNYIPFLKLKDNEIMGLSELDYSIKRHIIPFFDFPRKDGDLTEEQFTKHTERMRKKFDKYLQDMQNCYLDIFDISTSFFINGVHPYEYLLEIFKAIPVLGIDRDTEHINAVISGKQNGKITSEKVAIRLTTEDFIDFDLTQDDIEDLLDDAISLFEKIDIVFDCRYCKDLDCNNISNNIIGFIPRFIEHYQIDRVIVTGTSIPVPPAPLISTYFDDIIERAELALYSLVKEEHPNIYIGDYTIVGAEYSDAGIPGDMMQNVIVPKTIYSYDSYHYMQRGGGVRTHPQGYRQYNTQAQNIVSKNFYRGKAYSYGDEYIEEKSRFVGKNVMPGTIIKPTVNAHITYMVSGYTV